MGPQKNCIVLDFEKSKLEVFGCNPDNDSNDHNPNFEWWPKSEMVLSFCLLEFLKSEDFLEFLKSETKNDQQEEAHVLLVCERRNKKFGFLQSASHVSGKTEGAEPPRGAIKRELKEELGLCVADENVRLVSNKLELLQSKKKQKKANYYVVNIDTSDAQQTPERAGWVERSCAIPTDTELPIDKLRKMGVSEGGSSSIEK
jgi:8-oxo-dGTP pyrophosphatase MutT (NUDIX family)